MIALWIVLGLIGYVVVGAFTSGVVHAAFYRFDTIYRSLCDSPFSPRFGKTKFSTAEQVVGAVLWPLAWVGLFGVGVFLLARNPVLKIVPLLSAVSGFGSRLLAEKPKSVPQSTPKARVAMPQQDDPIYAAALEEVEQVLDCSVRRDGEQR
jgi:hypothetical protein